MAALLAICQAGCQPAGLPSDQPEPGAVLARLSMDRDLEDRILALDPGRIGESDVRGLLARGPAPRIMCLQGSLPAVTMDALANFLIGMGYPADRLRNPADGTFTYNGYVPSARRAGQVAWCYEHDGMAPILIGHSMGGMAAIRTLYELDGQWHDRLGVWDPASGRPQERTTITDPLTGRRRGVVGLKIGYACAIATGRRMRIVLGQWDMIRRLRVVPDSVEEFTGFFIRGDPIGGDISPTNRYRAAGKAVVHNVRLGPCGHTEVIDIADLPRNPAAKEWIDRYTPGVEEPALPGAEAPGKPAIVLAAEVWYYVRKHWCIEAQRLILARRARA